MERYTVTGMSCAACSARVEKAVSAVSGVTACSVNLLTGSMGVEGSASPADVVRAVEQAGYGATLENSPSKPKSVEPKTQSIGRQLIVSGIVLIVLMYVSMGHTMWHWPLPAFFETNPLATALLQGILSAIVLVINQRFFINGFRGILNRSPNMDTLVALGSGASFVYSTVVLFLMADAVRLGDAALASAYAHDLYFESAAMILVLITVGKLLEARSKGKTTDALKSLMALAPKTATVLRNETEVTVPIEEVKRGDIFVVRPGEAIPVDGVVLEGLSAVNEAALTGESIPVDKKAGDTVSASTINQSGFLRCEAVRVGEDTTLAQIIQMVSDAAATKAPIAKIADKVSGVFVPIVIAIALITACGWLIADQTIGFAVARGVSVLVISCPCALGLATPVAIMVGNGKGAKHGVLFKTAVSLENTGKITTVVLDKTGTVTEGIPTVTDILPLEADDQTLLTIAYGLEQHSEHPLAKAVVRECESRSLSPVSVTDFAAVAGSGVTALQGTDRLLGGNLAYIRENMTVSDTVEKQAETFAKDGKTPLFFAKNGVLQGIIAVADTVKADSAEAITSLREMGLRTVMLTGDTAHTAEAIGKQVGVDEIIADVRPHEKEAVVRRLCESGKVMMVGDGINDAPALTRADIGVAIGAGTDVAMDAADIVLVNSRLSDVPAAIRLSRATLRIIHQNLFWAFIYNVIGIPLAAGVFIPLLGWQLNPMFGAAAMSLSSFCVVSNALRLNRFKWSTATPTRKKKEKKAMVKTMHIEGMMCPHCQARVQKVLEELPCVESAVVSHEKGTAVVTLKETTDTAILTAAVTAQGYTVTSVE